MNHYRELVYVNARVMPAGTSITYVQLRQSEWELWLVPGRSRPFDVWQVAAPVAATPGIWTLSAPVIHFEITMLPNPAFMPTEWKSNLDMAWSTCPDKRQFFEVDMLEHWLPVVHRRRLLERTLSAVGFYAVYDVAEDTRRDEEDVKETSLTFDFVGELDLLNNLLVTNAAMEMRVLQTLNASRAAMNERMLHDTLGIAYSNGGIRVALNTLRRAGLVLVEDVGPERIYRVSAGVVEALR